MHERFGKYVLLAPIAHGGMAEVFKATLRGESGFERLVAIKCILPHLSEDGDFISMFVDEAKIAVQLSHSNIAQILDLGFHEGRYFIALEYIHGKDLRAIAQREEDRGGSVPIPVACQIVMRVAAALHHAHGAIGHDGRHLQVIHRDVSPQNVLVSFDGAVKVIDFGLAKAAGRATQTRAGVLKGKLAYLSPEQAMGARIDGRSDIYALGICFHELLTGQRLFLRETDIETVLAVRSGTAARPSELASDVPAALDAIVMKALARDVGERYQDAMELHDDVESFIYSNDALFGRKQMAEYMRDLFPEEVMSETDMPELDADDLGLVAEESRVLAPDLTRELTVPALGERAMSPLAAARDSADDRATTARREPDGRGATIETLPPAHEPTATHHSPELVAATRVGRWAPTADAWEAEPDGDGGLDGSPAGHEPEEETLGTVVERPPTDTIPAPPSGDGTAPSAGSLEELLAADRTGTDIEDPGATVPSPRSLEELLRGKAGRPGPGQAAPAHQRVADEDEDETTST